MTKYVDFTWVVPVPQELLDGTVADKWIEEKDSADLEHEATFRWEFLIIPGQAVPTVCISDSGWISTGSSFTGRVRAEKAM